MFEETEFVIFSRSRWESVYTLESLTEEVKCKSYILCPEEEVAYYSKLGIPVVGRPNWISGIHQARQYALDSCLEKNLVMLDDGLCFYKIEVDSEGNKKMTSASYDEVNSMFEECLGYLSEVPLTGISLRQNNSKHSPLYEDYCHRQMNVHCIDVDYFISNDIRFDRLPLMEDFDMVLQVLSSGKRNRITHRFAQGKHSKSKANSPGGCSIYRDNKLQSKCANKLMNLYPNLVKVVDKKTKTSYKGMESRKDVRIQWKKAYKLGVSSGS